MRQPPGTRSGSYGATSPGSYRRAPRDCSKASLEAFAGRGERAALILSWVQGRGPPPGLRIRGIARVDPKTKELLKRLRPGEIAVIDHRDIDEVSAQAFVAVRPRAVVNAASSMSGRYPNPGPKAMVEAGIPLIDCVERSTFDLIRETDMIEIDDRRIYRNGVQVGEGERLTLERIESGLAQAQANLAGLADSFVDNTLEYARREKWLITGGISFPELRTPMKGRHSVVVVRGHGYREDLIAIASYIDELAPVLIGVDGGADVLIECGYTPHIIVGDMDSVTDAALRSGAEIVVHAYPGGKAPGLSRTQALGLGAVSVACPGTSEDLALLLAYEKGSELIVAVGTHSSLIDFLEKGRAGMASTFLVRLRVGSILVDAKGVSRIYQGRPKKRYPLEVALAALIPLLIVAALSQPVRQLLRLVLLRIRLMLGV